MITKYYNMTGDSGGDQSNGESRHPESYCHKCGSDNPVWSAENDLFNEVNGSPYGIMCPVCFFKMCQEKGVDVYFRATRKLPQVDAEPSPQEAVELLKEISKTPCTCGASVKAINILNKINIKKMNILKLKKKPITIEGIQYNGSNEDDIIEWTKGSEREAFKKAHLGSSDDGMGGKQTYYTLHIKTLEGIMDVSYMDFVLKGIKGEFYPCKPDIVAESFERVYD